MFRNREFLIFLIFVTFLTKLGNSLAIAENVSKKFGVDCNVGYTTFGMEEFNDYIDEWYVGFLGTSMEHIKGGIAFSGEVKYRLVSNPKIYLMCSGGYISDKTSGSILFEFFDDGSDKLNLEFHISAIPILLTGLYVLPAGKLNIHLGGGIGYYLGKVKREAKVQTYPELNEETVWDGSQIGFHVLSGVEYYITKRVSLSGNLMYRLAKIDKLEDENGKRVKVGLDQKILKLDFSGLEIKSGVNFYF